MASVELPARGYLERELDGFVRDNRFTIAVVFPAIGAITLLASAEALLPGPLNFNPYLLLFGVAVMRLPLLAGLAPLVTRRAAVGLVGLCGYTYAIETVGVLTGYPYGAFEYGVDLGPMLGGAVPAALPLFFVPLVVNAYLLCLLLFGRLARRSTGFDRRAATREPTIASSRLGAGDRVIGPYPGGRAFLVVNHDVTGFEFEPWIPVDGSRRLRDDGGDMATPVRWSVDDGHPGRRQVDVGEPIRAFILFINTNSYV